MASNRVTRARNFLSGNPHWEDITGDISGTIKDFILDASNPKQVAYCATSTLLYKSSNLDSIFPIWTPVFNIENYIAPTKGPVIYRVMGTIAQQNLLYVMGWAQSVAGVSGTYIQHIWRSADAGNSWTETTSPGIANGAAASYSFDTDEQGTTGDFTWNNNDGNFSGPGQVSAAFTVGQTKSILFSSAHLMASVEDMLNGSGKSSVLMSGTLTTRLHFSGFSDFDIGPNVTTFTSGSWTAISNLDNIYAGFDGRTCTGIELIFNITWIDATVLTGTINLDDYTVFGFGPQSPINSSFAVGQHFPNILYACANGVIRKSTDYGSTWSTHLSNIAYDLECPYAANTTDNNIVFINNNGQLYTAQGQTATLRTAWGTETAHNLANRIVTHVQSYTTIYTLFYNSPTYSIKVTTDGGINWSTVQTGLTKARSPAIWPYSAGEKLYFITTDNIYYSGDSGNTITSELGDFNTEIGTYQNPLKIIPDRLS